MNERIRVTEVLLVEDDGTTHRLSTEKALEMAKEQELDLIEVSPKANPPVVKIGDFGQYLYQLQKQAKKHIPSRQKLKPSALVLEQIPMIYKD